MDLATGAKEVYVMMSLFTREGAGKLVAECTSPLTGVGCVTRVYTGEAVFLLQDDGVHVRETYGVSFDELAAALDIPLICDPGAVRHSGHPSP